MKPKSHDEYEFDLQGELDRKSIAALSDLYERYTTGRVSLHAYLTGLLVLNNCLRGLVDEEVIATIDHEYNSLYPKWKRAVEAKEKRRGAA